MSAVASIDTGFAMRLYEALARADAGHNQFLSPFSVHVALAMVSAAARGETRRVLARLLGAPENVEEQNRVVAGWTRAIKDATGPVQLVVANALWAQQGIHLNPAYRQAVAEFYDSPCNEVDFQSATEQAVQTINASIADATAGKIPSLLTRALVGTDTRLIATNAVYFKGDWESAFDIKDTMDEDWHGPAGVRKVPMMQQRHGFLYCEDEEFQALELPYQGCQLAMLIVLPRKVNGLAALHGAGAADRAYRKTTASLACEKMVIVTLPRFKMASAYELKPVLSSLGAGLAFSDGADFSGMCDERLQLADVIHKAFIEVNEEGTEAAAATAVVTRKSAGASAPKLFRADHPFLFFIRHRQSNVVLFCGQVLEPG